MKRTEKTKNPLCDAVRKLRTALGESQQAFAYRMKTAIRTVARYETVPRQRGRRWRNSSGWPPIPEMPN